MHELRAHQRPQKWDPSRWIVAVVAASSKAQGRKLLGLCHSGKDVPCARGVKTWKKSPRNVRNVGHVTLTPSGFAR